MRKPRAGQHVFTALIKILQWVVPNLVKITCLISIQTCLNMTVKNGLSPFASVLVSAHLSTHKIMYASTNLTTYVYLKTYLRS